MAKWPPQDDMAISRTAEAISEPNLRIVVRASEAAEIKASRLILAISLPEYIKFYFS